MNGVVAGINAENSTLFLSTFADDGFFRPSAQAGVIGKEGNYHYFLWLTLKRI